MSEKSRRSGPAESTVRDPRSLRAALAIALLAFLGGIALWFATSGAERGGSAPGVAMAGTEDTVESTRDPARLVAPEVRRQADEEATAAAQERLEQQLAAPPEPLEPPGQRIAPRRLSGTVTAAGAPVEGALVVMTVGGNGDWGELRPTEVASARTDEAGAFDLGPAVGMVAVGATLFVASSRHANDSFPVALGPSAQDPATVQVDEVATVDATLAGFAPPESGEEADAPEDEPIRIALRNGELVAGMLVDTTNDRPLAGAVVVGLQIETVDVGRSRTDQLTRLEAAARVDLSDDCEPLWTTTDEAGRFELTGVERSSLQLVLQPGWRLLDGDRLGVGAGGPPLEVEVDRNAIVDVDDRRTRKKKTKPGDESDEDDAEHPVTAFVPSTERLRGIDIDADEVGAALLSWRRWTDLGPEVTDRVWNGRWGERVRYGLLVDFDAMTALTGNLQGTSGGREPFEVAFDTRRTYRVDAQDEALLTHVGHPAYSPEHDAALSLVDQLGRRIEEPVRITLVDARGDETTVTAEPDARGDVEVELFGVRRLRVRVESDDPAWPAPFVSRQLAAGQDAGVQQVVVSRPAALLVHRPEGTAGAWACELRPSDAREVSHRFVTAEDTLVIDTLPCGRWFVGRGGVEEDLDQDPVRLEPGERRVLR